MQSFDRGFEKRAKARRDTGKNILRGLSTFGGILGGAMAGQGAGLALKGTTQSSFREPGKDTVKDKALDYAPLAGAVLGGVLGGKRAASSWKAKPATKKLAFDKGFGERVRRQEKTAISSGVVLMKSLWENAFRRVGETLGAQSGATLGKVVASGREDRILRRTLEEAKKRESFETEDAGSLQTMAGMTGVSNRAAEVAAGAGLALGAVPLLRLAKPYGDPKANWAAQVANRIQRRVQGTSFKPSLGNLALALGAGSLATGFLSAALSPVAAEAAGSLTARLRDKDIVKGVERYYSQKAQQGVERGFDQAKTAASLIGVMPGISSGLRTMKSFGKIRTAKPVSGQSIGPRSKTNITPSPVKAPNSGQPGAATSRVTSTGVPKPMSYGSRLMGSWM